MDPKLKNGVLVKYTMTYHPSDGRPIRIDIASSLYYYKLRYLDREERFSVSLSASTAVGTGPEASFIIESFSNILCPPDIEYVERISYDEIFFKFSHPSLSTVTDFTLLGCEGQASDEGCKVSALITK